MFSVAVSTVVPAVGTAVLVKPPPSCLAFTVVAGNCDEDTTESPVLGASVSTGPSASLPVLLMFAVEMTLALLSCLCFFR